MNEQNQALVQLFEATAGHRAAWLAFIYQEMLDAGIENAKEICSRAIRKCGDMHGKAKRALYSPDDSFKKKAGMIFQEDVGKLTFQAVTEIEGTTLVNTVYNCPLANSWKSMGLSDEMRADLCDIAMEGDVGIAVQNGLDLTWDETLAKNCSCCKLCFKAKE